VTELDPGGDVVDGNPGGDVTVGLANLTITEEMMSGVQRWSCSAENELNEEPLMMTLEFTVTGTVFIYCIYSRISRQFFG